MPKKPSLCLPTRSLSAPCCECGQVPTNKPGGKTHVVTDGTTQGSKFYCEEHCPEHGRPLLTAA